MRSKGVHVSDEDLLLAADGELSESDTRQVSEHLAACWDCRSRRARIEATIAEFVEARHEALNPQLPPGTGRRGLLKAHLSQLARSSESGWWARFTRALVQSRAVTAGLAVTLVLSIAVLILLNRSQRRISSADRSLIVAEPSRKLTPGAVRQVSLRDICSAPQPEDAARFVPASLQRQVFQEYGIEGAGPRDYEVDFLITPELGGSNDIHNLWPEPYHSTAWNAHVKDELEDLLRAKVCSGEIDLGTAQRDISSDWISAYKKYFHTNSPL
jgi:hypothetical protein